MVKVETPQRAPLDFRGIVKAGKSCDRALPLRDWSVKQGLTAKLQNLGRQFLGMSCDFGNDANLVGWIGFRFQVSHNRILPVDMEEELVVIRADLAVQNSGDRLVDVGGNLAKPVIELAYDVGITNTPDHYRLEAQRLGTFEFHREGFLTKSASSHSYGNVVHLFVGAYAFGEDRLGKDRGLLLKHRC